MHACLTPWFAAPTPSPRAVRQYGVLAEVLSARLADVVRELAEKECSVRDLNEKLYRTFDRVAEQVGKQCIVLGPSASRVVAYRIMR